MNHEAQVRRMEGFPQVLSAMVKVVGNPVDARWKPPPPDDGSWSINEIVHHLADEEEADFRVRVEMTLTDPASDWPPIDPVGWARERHYNDGDVEEALARFSKLRQENVAWLRRLECPDWSSTHTHPKFGSMKAGEIMAAWVAHDALHLRQIARRLFQLAQRDGGEFSVEYAGAWAG